MISHIPAYGPVGAALLSKTGGSYMDIILSLGAHRSASTSYQHYISDNREGLSERGIGYWGPKRMRGGMLAGLFPVPFVANGRNLTRRAQGRIRMNLSRCEKNAVQTLVVSDENLIGTMRNCVRTKTLYPAVGDRIARVAEAFGGDIKRIVMSIRAQDLWWSSAIAYTVARGHAVPTSLAVEMMACSTRTWRDVITDLACAVPSADIVIAPFEQFAGQPQALLEATLNAPAPVDTAHHWRNRTPDLPHLRALLKEQGSDPDLVPQGTGRWNPFTPQQAAQLREHYADDQHWLHAGADGLARLATDPTRTQTGTSLHAGILTEGRNHDIRQEKLARSG